jgi:hypothetical protein
MGRSTFEQLLTNLLGNAVTISVERELGMGTTVTAAACNVPACHSDHHWPSPCRALHALTGSPVCGLTVRRLHVWDPEEDTPSEEPPL